MKTVTIYVFFTSTSLHLAFTSVYISHFPVSINILPEQPNFWKQSLFQRLI
uniref:Uncharacterized protein n=1 Tax=Anguilla anguilla TaxID=7936 RepID=A0A0E9PPS0_ANGAN